jgi:hypothetical protein
MKNFKRKIAVLALVGGTGLIALTSPAAAAAGPNDGGRNCHGVVLSYFATSGMSPGQLHKDVGASAQDVQETADILCSL